MSNNVRPIRQDGVIIPAELRRLHSAGRRLARFVRREPTWRGVYQRVEDVPVRRGYEADLWLRGTRQFLENAVRGGSRLEGDRALLGVLVASHGITRILDYGGGMGIDYALLRNTIGPVRYTVVDLPAVIAIGRELLPEVCFRPDLPEHSEVELVYVRAALQAVPDPFGALRKLLSYRAKHVLLLDVPAGDIPTFVSAQLNVPGSVLTHWFFNLRELTSLAREAGYDVALCTPAARRRVRLDAPPQYQLAHSVNLLLRLP